MDMAIDMIEPEAQAPANPTREADPAEKLGQRSIALVQNTLTEFDKVAAGLAELNAKYRNVVYPVATTKGMAEAKAARLAIREPRYAVTKAAKAAKDPLNALKKDIDARAAQITEALLVLEDPIHQQIEAEEERKAAEKAERERVERERVMAITQRIADIRAYHALALECRTAERVQGLVDKLQAIEIDPGLFEEFAEEARAAHASTLAAMQTIHARKVEEEAERARAKAEQEAEAARLAAERAEIERLRAEQAERERRAAEARALEEERARERREAEAAELQRQREAFEAEQVAARAEAQRLQDERDAEDARRRAVWLQEEKALAERRAELERQRAEAVNPPYVPPTQEEIASGVVDVEIKAEPMEIEEPAAAPLASDAEPIEPMAPTDDDVIAVAARALCDAFDWSFERSIDRLSAIRDWRLEAP